MHPSLAMPVDETKGAMLDDGHPYHAWLRDVRHDAGGHGHRLNLL